MKVKKETVIIEKEKPKGMIPFRVYIPEDKKNLINKYISYAKLYENNQVWQVMEKAFKLLEEKESNEKRILEEIPKRMINFEERLVFVENALESQQNQEKEEEGNKVHTFGGKNE